MLPDYEIKRTKTRFEKVVPYIELIIMLIIIQSIIMLFTAGPAQEDAIRFRLLAHSDAPVDQQIKMEIQRKIQPLIEKAVNTSQSKKELGDNLAVLESTILDVASSMSNGRTVSLERKEALFPPKRSGLFIHPQATYDAYILTIGSGRGDNWWCAVFPKICYPDDEEEGKEEKVTFFIWEWIKGLFE
ncbi:stage II sporulation protein R [Sporosarcina limicola]|uniref:Stage II sporulation protein R n=1 Tax=Sporosarcina limicola TaxID=34101 RepID=A0A927MQW3_9BACL|nr:stage II sporulation protein R [Sporosarcina limicola]MBE1555716.1 stage II sporulation protein R [Sporosarcina limicola]